MPVKKRKLSAVLGRRAARAVSKAVKAPPLTAAQRYEKAVAKMESKLTRRKPVKPTKPLTAMEKHRRAAKVTGEGVTRAIGLGSLIDVLNPKKKKKKD